MNYGISVLFRAIPLVMALFCFFYGGYIYLWGDDSSRMIAGPVVFFLGSICIALFATAATIIRQIIHTYNPFAKYFLPILGYSVALATFICGIAIFKDTEVAEFFVAGHIVCGLGLITGCVATAATVSTRFSLIPENSTSPSREINAKGFTQQQELIFESIAAFFAALAWAWTIVLLAGGSTPHFVAGSVMGGLIVIFVYYGQTRDFVGFVLIGLGLVCYSISSKVILLVKIWKAEFPLAARIPLIPVLTALICLFLASFLFEEAVYKEKFFVPARVIVGLGAICFTLFSIVSILESGAKKSK